MGDRQPPCLTPANTPNQKDVSQPKRMHTTNGTILTKLQLFSLASVISLHCVTTTVHIKYKMLLYVPRSLSNNYYLHSGRWVTDLLQDG